MNYYGNPGRFQQNNFQDIFKSMGMPNAMPPQPQTPMGGFGQMGRILGGAQLGMQGLAAFGPQAAPTVAAERPQVVGQALSGAMSGAMTGGMVAGPYGAIIGGLLGAAGPLRRLFGKQAHRSHI